MSSTPQLMTEAYLDGVIPNRFKARTISSNVSDFNLITTPGSYLIVNREMANRPPGTSYGELLVYEGYYLVQDFTPTTSACIYRRIRTSPESDNWSRWMRIAAEYVS